MAALARWQPPCGRHLHRGRPACAALAGGRPCRWQPLWVVPLPASYLPAGVEPAVGRPLRRGLQCLVMTEVTFGARKISHRVSFFPSREVHPHAWISHITNKAHNLSSTRDSNASNLASIEP
ncbi:hypothetical protein BHM03_00060706 [Ensete ventricosum]|nr:hypothetical protein BHM03_00060706 [Ensete ventricosum]